MVAKLAVPMVQTMAGLTAELMVVHWAELTAERLVGTRAALMAGYWAVQMVASWVARLAV